MNNYFTEQEYFNAEKQRKNCLLFYCATAVVFLAITVFIYIIFSRLPYGSSKIQTYKIIQYALSALYIVFSFVFLGIKYKRVYRYAKFCKRLIKGIKQTSELDFFEFDDRITMLDGVECKTAIFLEWNEYKKIYFERKVLVFYEKEFPLIPENAFVKIVTQGNFLISYEVLEIREYSEEDKPRPPEYILR